MFLTVFIGVLFLLPLDPANQNVQNQQWQLARINFPSQGGYIIIQGVRGRGSQGDIAIDDIRLTSQSCGVSSKYGLAYFICNFQKAVTFIVKKGVTVNATFFCRVLLLRRSPHRFQHHSHPFQYSHLSRLTHLSAEMVSLKSIFCGNTELNLGL